MDQEIQPDMDSDPGYLCMCGSMNTAMPPTLKRWYNGGMISQDVK